VSEIRHIVARATSTPASQTRAPPAYAAVNTDPLGPDREGLNFEQEEESDHEEEDLQKRTMTFRTPCTPHLAREIPFSIGDDRNVALPTRAQE